MGTISYSHLAFFLLFIFYAILTYAFRLLWKWLLRKKKAADNERSLLIITVSDIAEAVVENIQKNNYAGFNIAGVALIDDAFDYSDGANADDLGLAMEEETALEGGGGITLKERVSVLETQTKTVAGIPVVADGSHAALYVCREWIDEVIVVPSNHEEYPQEMMDELQETGVTIHLNLARTSNEPGKKQFVERVNGYTVLTTSINYASIKQLFMKRIMDILGGLVGCLFTGVLLLFVAPAIYINSPGPIFFAQERVGRNGKKFKMYKFRSMYLDAEERKAELMRENKMSSGKMFKLDFDPRVIGNKILPDGTKKTGFGQFLRNTSLDEFPQFFNVLRGDMSLVGTRPPLVGEVSEYELHHRARLSIKPGITGLWQVCGRSDITDFEDVVRLDRQYISEWNLWLDIKILFKTVWVVLTKKGSA